MRVQDDTEDFQCDVCLLCGETKAAAARGLLGVVGSPANRQEGKTIHNVQRPIPFRTTASVSQKAPLRAPGSRATPVKTQQKLPSLRARCCVKTAELALAHSEIGHNDGEDERKKRKKGKVAVKLLQVPPFKNICRGREDRKKKTKRRKRKQAFYNFKEKDAAD